MFQCSLPQNGVGPLTSREDVKMLGTDKERTLFEPQDYFWKKMAQDLSIAGVCTDCYFFPSSYIDISSIGSISSVSGGDIYSYTNFSVPKDGLRFINDLHRSMARPFGYDGLMRVRSSNGLKISDHFGNFFMRNKTDIELGGIDSSKSFGVSIQNDGKLDEKGHSYLQIALLYTDSFGKRLVRVHNVSLPNTSLISNLFKFIEADTTMCFLAKCGIF